MLLVRSEGPFTLAIFAAISSAINVLSIQLFQLGLSQSKAEKSNTSAKGLLGIAKKLMNFLAIPSKPLALVFDFSSSLWDNLNGPFAL